MFKPLFVALALASATSPAMAADLPTFNLTAKNGKFEPELIQDRRPDGLLVGREVRGKAGNIQVEDRACRAIGVGIAVEWRFRGIVDGLRHHAPP